MGSSVFGGTCCDTPGIYESTTSVVGPSFVPRHAPFKSSEVDVVAKFGIKVALAPRNMEVYRPL